jgi:phosphoribosylanthranilate isomerase
MKPLVKICGITNEKDALFCAEMGTNFLGFIFYRQSPRYVEPQTAARIIRKLPSSVTPVGVFVEERRNMIQTIIEQTGIRHLQLSGDESPQECNGFQLPVWKAFRIRSKDSVDNVQQYSISAAMLDGAKDGYGGSGELADFEIAVAMKQYHKLVLAGGLNPNNVVEAISIVQPYAIDVNSGVEHSPGKKDQKKVFTLFKKLKELS